MEIPEQVDPAEKTADYSASEPEYWNYKHIFIALGVAFFLQVVSNPPEFGYSTAYPMALGMTFDLLILLRTFAAMILRERGKGWLFYTILLYLSPIWIQVAAELGDYVNNLYYDYVAHAMSLPYHLVHVVR